MSDPWLELGRNPLARRVLQRVGLKTPPQLLRSNRPWADEVLADKRILFNRGGLFEQALSSGLSAAKAHLHSLASTSSHESSEPEPQVFQASLFDGTHIQNIRDLEQLYQFFRPQLRRMGFNHRIVILARATQEEGSPEVHACAQAIEGFARSLSKELGPKGVYVNTIRVPCQSPSHASLRLIPLCTYLLADYSSFMTGQTLSLDLQGPPLSELPLGGSLAGKRVLVTGAAQGIGHAIARRYAEEGAHVIGLDRPEAKEALEDLVKSIEGESILCDLNGPQSIPSILTQLERAPAPLDILIHNAGITRDRSLFAMKPDHWQAVLHLNLEVVHDLTMAILQRGMIASQGRVLCMSSIVGIAGNYGQTNYSAAKAGLIGLVKGLSQHLGRDGTTANAIAPGFIETAMTSDLPFLAKQFGRRLCSLNQGGTPEDVAELVCFLGSPAAQGINGSVLRICGGNFLGA
jgi:3-oxoacyl-[acyl-carrier protein] reductase